MVIVIGEKWSFYSLNYETERPISWGIVKWLPFLAWRSGLVSVIGWVHGKRRVSWTENRTEAKFLITTHGEWGGWEAGELPSRRFWRLTYWFTICFKGAYCQGSSYWVARDLRRPRYSSDSSEAFCWYEGSQKKIRHPSGRFSRAVHKVPSW